MDTSSTIARIAGSALAGAAAFAVGFYAGFFLILGVWGLDAGQPAFVFIAGGLGTLAAAGAIALTVSRGMKLAAFATAVGLGLVLLLGILAFDADAAAMGVGGLILAVVTAVLVRSGKMDTIAG